MRKEIERLIELDRERRRIGHIGSLLAYDLETGMPEKAGADRAEQLALVEGLAHERSVRPEIGELLGKLGSTTENPLGDPALEASERAYLRCLRRDWDRATRLPSELVEEMARATGLAHPAWVQARRAGDFGAFAPHLEKVLGLTRQAAACLDPAKPAYDVLLDRYEPGSTEASVAAVFKRLRADLVALLGKIGSRPQVDDGFLKREVADDAQRAVSLWLMDLLGFDRSRGRLDLSAHPFTSTLGPDDVRITTRFVPGNFTSSLFSTVHETGHALYELGIAPGSAFVDTELASASSMAIHESQSRMWENLVARSEAFWRRNFGRLAELAGPLLAGVDARRFFRAINKVEPSLVRVEADEVTYGLHVILRFELEAELVSGRLAVAELPAAWRAKTRELLGLEVPNDSVGCLQDVHWSAGLFGYFPSYALGNLYAAQFWEAMRKDIPDLEARIEGGDLGSLLGWLRAKVHGPGQCYLPSELVERVTGSPLDAGHFTTYLETKYARVYGF